MSLVQSRHRAPAFFPSAPIGPERPSVLRPAAHQAPHSTRFPHKILVTGVQFPLRPLTERCLMKTFICFFLLLTQLTNAAMAWSYPGDGPATQIERGRQWFLHSSKGTACATCHSLEGAGTAIGPDLTRLASVIGPRGLVTTIQMTMTACVQQIRLQNGRIFPGILKQKDGEQMEIYDLTKTPAVLLKIKSADVAAMKTNNKWSHPPTSTGYTPDELADIIAYLKFVATGVAKDVTASELR